jgi:hypothetical protein
LLASWSVSYLTGLVIVLGAVSGGLAVRDFDQADAYRAWATSHPDLADSLATARTHRGFPVYGRLEQEAFADLGDGGQRTVSRSRKDRPTLPASAAKTPLDTAFPAALASNRRAYRGGNRPSRTEPFHQIEQEKMAISHDRHQTTPQHRTDERNQRLAQQLCSRHE